jgi:glutathionylspermidine synthase
MFADPFGQFPAMRRARFVEPPWKAVLSNKGIFALLWETAPGHPSLPPCFFEDDPRAATLKDRYARKLLLSGEGANVELVEDGEALAHMPGDYGSEGYVRQALHLPPDFEGRYPVPCSWLVGDGPAGMGEREDSSLATSNQSRLAPRVILG